MKLFRGIAVEKELKDNNPKLLVLQLVSDRQLHEEAVVSHVYSRPEKNLHSSPA